MKKLINTLTIILNYIIGFTFFIGLIILISILTVLIIFLSFGGKLLFIPTQKYYLHKIITKLKTFLHYLN